MKTFAVVLLAILFAANIAVAAEKQPPKYKARTYIGGNSCMEVLDDFKDQGKRTQVAVMVASFISGSNHAKNRDSKILLNNMLIVTQNFCRQNPKKPFITALINLDRVIDRQIRLSKEGKKEAP